MSAASPAAPVAAGPTAARISDFLAQNRLALIGVSREKRSYSRALLTALRRHGHEVVPVNPVAPEIEGLICYPRVQDIPSPVDGALVVVGPKHMDAVLMECLERGIPRVWVPMPRRGAGREGAERLRQEGLSVIYGFCPLMFLPQANFLHHLHGYIERHSRAYRQA